MPGTESPENVAENQLADEVGQAQDIRRPSHNFNVVGQVLKRKTADDEPSYADIGQQPEGEAGCVDADFASVDVIDVPELTVHCQNRLDQCHPYYRYQDTVANHQDHPGPMVLDLLLLPTTNEIVFATGVICTVGDVFE